MNNSRTSNSKNAKFSGYYFYVNTDIEGDFQICISVPLNTYNNSGSEDTVNKIEKVLGIPWDSDKDILVYDSKNIMKDAHKSKSTKRNLLKMVPLFYDPIGLIHPIWISL